MGDFNVCGKRGEEGGDQVGDGLVSLVMWRAGIGAPEMAGGLIESMGLDPCILISGILLFSAFLGLWID